MPRARLHACDMQTASPAYVALFYAARYTRHALPRVPTRLLRYDARAALHANSDAH